MTQIDHIAPDCVKVGIFHSKPVTVIPVKTGIQNLESFDVFSKVFGVICFGSASKQMVIVIIWLQFWIPYFDTG